MLGTRCLGGSDGRYEVTGPEGPIEVHARFMVGADGARSRVARDLGLDRNTHLLIGAEDVFTVSEPVPTPVTFFVTPSSREDVGVLAGRPRHDCYPQSLMIRGVMSPGPEGARDIANRGRAESLQVVRNVDAEL